MKDRALLAEEVENCPHCNANYQKLKLKEGSANGNQVFSVWCFGCGASGPFAVLEVHAIEGWNRRATKFTSADDWKAEMKSRLKALVKQSNLLKQEASKIDAQLIALAYVFEVGWDAPKV